MIKVIAIKQCQCTESLEIGRLHFEKGEIFGVVDENRAEGLSQIGLAELYIEPEIEEPKMIEPFENKMDNFVFENKEIVKESEIEENPVEEKSDAEEIVEEAIEAEKAVEVQVEEIIEEKVEQEKVEEPIAAHVEKIVEEKAPDKAKVESKKRKKRKKNRK